VAERFRELTTPALLLDFSSDEVAAPPRRVWVLQVLAIWLLARAITTTALLVMHTQLLPTSRGAGTSGLVDYSTIWDGQWYWLVAFSGYPSTLPLAADGTVAESQWAFMPAYPLLAAGLAFVLGAAWPVGGVLLSTLFGFLAAPVLYNLFRTRLSHPRALFAVALVATGPVSFIFQMAYAESMQLFLLALSLLLLIRRRWAFLVPTIAVMAFTRPTGLAFAFALVLYWIGRHLAAKRDPFPARERLIVAGLAVYSGFLGLAWAGIAWMVTGSMTAYTDTELAWRGSWLGQTHLLPFTPWFEAAPFWVGAAAAPLVVIAVVVAFALLLLTPRARALGLESRAWVVAYGAYLFAVFFPQSSLLRLLIPMFPLAAVLVPRRSKAAGAAILVSATILQLTWLWFTWGPVTTWWSVP
jgi:hypothetical protein